MSRWAKIKQAHTLDWAKEWREIYEGTKGAYDWEYVKSEIDPFIEQMDQAYEQKNPMRFLELKSQLVNKPWWRGSKPTVSEAPSASSESDTAPPTTVESQTLWDAIEVGTLR